MSSAILVHPDFDASWPFSADHFHELWRKDGPVEFVRVPHGDKRCASEILSKPQSITRLVAFNVPVTENCLAALSNLREAVLPREIQEKAKARGVTVISTRSEGFWG